MYCLRRVCFALLSVGLLVPIGAQKLDESSVKLKQGEALTPLHFTVRSNYVVPQQVSVEEGVFEIVLNNPNGVANGKSAKLDTDRGSSVAELQTSEKGPRSRMIVKLQAGKHVLKLDNQQKWTVAIEVRAKESK